MCTKSGTQIERTTQQKKNTELSIKLVYVSAEISFNSRDRQRRYR